jgi:hypothetical protein
MAHYGILDTQMIIKSSTVIIYFSTRYSPFENSLLYNQLDLDPTIHFTQRVHKPNC